MCNKLTIEIWEICIKHSVEWMISTDILEKLYSIFSMPNIELFASPLNKQLGHYASWLPDPGSGIIDAVPVLSHGKYFYIFLPFSLIYPEVKTSNKSMFHKYQIAKQFSKQATNI